MFEIEINSTDVEEKNVNSTRLNKEFVVRTQMGRIAINGEIRNIKIPLATGSEAYPKGKYTVDPHSFYVGNFGDLQIGRLKLVSVAQRTVMPATQKAS